MTLHWQCQLQACVAPDKHGHPLQKWNRCHGEMAQSHSLIMPLSFVSVVHVTMPASVCFFALYSVSLICLGSRIILLFISVAYRNTTFNI